MGLSRQQWIVLGAGAAGGILLARYGSVVAPISIVGSYVSNVFERGSQLTSSTLVDGVVQELPEQLGASAAAVLGFVPDQDTYSLARMGRSEGVDGMEYRMHVALNDLRALQATYGAGIYSSMTALMIHSKNAAADGHYSAQKLGKRYSTAHDPYEGDYALAQKVIADDVAGIDPTGGAVKFIDKDGPLYVSGQRVGLDEFLASWASQGLQPTTLPGASDNFLVFTRTA